MIIYIYFKSYYYYIIIIISEPDSTITINVACDTLEEGHVTFSIKDQTKGISEIDSRVFFIPQVLFIIIIITQSILYF